MKINSEQEMLNYGREFAKKIKFPMVIELIGDVGAGKTELEKKVNKVYQENNRVNLCTFYWCYFLAHLQNFYVANAAKKKGVNIYNVNKESYVRSFEFADYDTLFS